MEIFNNKIRIQFSERGAEIYSLKYFGKEIIWQKKKGFWPQSAPILFPFCGFLKDGYYLHDDQRFEAPAHGFASSQDFKIVSHDDCKICFLLDSNEQRLKLYPFKFSMSVTYELCESELFVSFTVKNLEKERTLPFSLGWHPGFKFSKNAYIKFSKNEFTRRTVLKGGLIGEDEKFSLRNNILPLNTDTLKLGGIVLENPQTKVRLVDFDYEIDFNFKDFPNLVIWGQPGADFICIEPWYGMGDHEDHNHIFIEKDQLLSVNPGDKKTLDLSIKIKA